MRHSIFLILTVVGTSLILLAPTCDHNYALDFDGDVDRLETPDDGAFEPAQAATIETWVLARAETAILQPIVAKEFGNGEISYGLWFENDQIHFGLLGIDPANGGPVRSMVSFAQPSRGRMAPYRWELGCKHAQTAPFHRRNSRCFSSNLLPVDQL